jgi:hypothetical protein
MLKWIKSNWLFIILGLVTLVGAIVHPEATIQFTGGFAWFTLFLMWFISISWVIVGIFGGHVTFEAEGIIPTVKKYWKKYKKGDLS